MRRVVITGMGAVTPVGNDVPSMWEAMLAGRHGFGPITRFDASDLKVSLAAQVKDFDPLQYIEKGEVRKTDLYSQYAIAAASQAMEDSGLSGQIENSRLGVYIGSGIGGFETFMDAAHTLHTKGAGRISPFFIPMMIGNMATALVAIRFKAQGPCLPVVTACATGTHAIGEAFRAIKHGYADAIISGGAEATITPLAMGGFSSCRALSNATDPDCCSIPFDIRRDGFVMGEGAGVLVLEEYDHAVARGAHIYCEISGYGNTCDAYHITAPDPEATGGAAMIREAFAEAGRTPDSKLYINPHGTSTPLNDKTETLAIKLALGEETAHKVAISSTKSMTGHMLGAAGGVEAIVSVLALRDGKAPPTVGLSQPDPDCDLDYLPGSSRTLELTQSLSMSLGFGGHNACVLFNKL